MFTQQHWVQQLHTCTSSNDEMTHLHETPARLPVVNSCTNMQMWLMARDASQTVAMLCAEHVAVRYAPIAHLHINLPKSHTSTKQTKKNWKTNVLVEYIHLLNGTKSWERHVRQHDNECIEQDLRRSSNLLQVWIASAVTSCCQHHKQ